MQITTEPMCSHNSTNGSAIRRDVRQTLWMGEGAAASRIGARSARESVEHSRIWTAAWRSRPRSALSWRGNGRLKSRGWMGSSYCEKSKVVGPGGSLDLSGPLVSQGSDLIWWGYKYINFSSSLREQQCYLLWLYFWFRRMLPLTSWEAS